MPYRKVPGMPKGRVTAYAYFVKACRDGMRKLDQQIIYIELSKVCSEKWQSMTAEEKAPFYYQAELDKQRFCSEMDVYFNEHSKIVHKSKPSKVKRKRTKDPNAPKRFLTPFFWFCHDARPKIQKRFPWYTVQEISKELGRLWSEADDKARELYIKIFQRDKKRYRKEVELYYSKASTVVKAPIPEGVTEENEERESEFDEYDEDMEKEALLRGEGAGYRTEEPEGKSDVKDDK